MCMTMFVSESVCTIIRQVYCVTGVCKYIVHECVCVSGGGGGGWVVYNKIRHTIVYSVMYATMQVCAQV